MATRNPWLKFKALLQGEGRTVVTVISSNTDGTSTVQLRSGEEIKVSGEQVTAGNKAIIMNGRIGYKVPNLPNSIVKV